MSKDGDGEVDLKDVELNEVEQEKQPMTDGAAGNELATSPSSTEKNGCVKVKIPEEADAKFTGLSKEELLKVAGTPGWVRTRWALLILFWLGWIGMLAGAVVIIVQAPSCKPLPTLNWWNMGPLYQIGDLKAFSDAGNLRGVEEKLDHLSQLKVKGLVLGPIHVAAMDKLATLEFEEISSDAGTLDQFNSLIHMAHKKGISVVLDLTPNYLGRVPWFANSTVTSVAERLKVALVFWLSRGVDGVKLSGIDRVTWLVPSLWSDIRAIVQNSTQEKKRVLIGVTDRRDTVEVSRLLNHSGVDLLLSEVLQPSSHSPSECAYTVQQLYSTQPQTQLAWNVGGRTQGHLASLAGPDLVQLYQMLLFTLPGTPVFNYGDEIGLEDQDTKFPKMLWDTKELGEDINETVKAEREQRLAFSSFFKSLSDLRTKERSLIHGDYLLLHNDTTSLAYLRYWDQSERYLPAFNWGPDPATLRLSHSELPARATVRLSTDPAKHKTGSEVDLTALELEPRQAVLLHFPFSS
ncbi:4F2 cell-surface antigen heavy chain-like [Scleropages formosus]|uniref:4F2 cell-surface antigen heavy chain-like n=1 Tax=Scleropages formosus TaxID=113540 RepID=A0A0P7US55_SCLFO|nr:4F2 cell-surface antigen heavy chain isoform X2 [Scleropages formosus]KPP72530.1 4F2 cell-surface antigen heavy chain-like [Scleropages formosus]